MSPVKVAPGGAIVITGIVVPGDTVLASLSTDPPTLLGTAVADGSGQFRIEATIPPGVAVGTYSITVGSTACPAEASISIQVVKAPTPGSCKGSIADRTFFPGQVVTWTLHVGEFDTSKPVKLVLKRTQGSSYSAVLFDGAWPASGTVTFTVPADAPVSNKYQIEQIGTSKSGQQHHHKDNKGKDKGKGHDKGKGKKISKACDVKVVGPVTPPPQKSSCEANSKARTFFPGQQIAWTLHRGSFNTSKPVKLVLETKDKKDKKDKKSHGYSVVVFDGAWPKSGKVTFTVPVGAPVSNKYQIDQIGTSKSGQQHHHKDNKGKGHDKAKKISKVCDVKVASAPAPIASLTAPEEVAGVQVPGAALLVGAVSVLTLVRLRLRRRWA